MIITEYDEMHSNLTAAFKSFYGSLTYPYPLREKTYLAKQRLIHLSNAATLTNMLREKGLLKDVPRELAIRKVKKEAGRLWLL